MEPMSVIAAVVGFMPMVGVLGIPLGAVALRRLRRARFAKLGKAAAWFGIVYGALWVVFIAAQSG